MDVETVPSKMEKVEKLFNYKCTKSELPLYRPIHFDNQKSKSEIQPEEKTKLHRAIESNVRAVRQELQHGYGLLKNQWTALENYCDNLKALTVSSIDHLNQPQNVFYRYGAIAAGGLVGFIFAAPMGVIGKAFFTALGAGSIATLCYPRQAEQLAQDALYEGYKGYATTHNFIKGVNDLPIEPINKFPSTIEDLKLLVWDLYCERIDDILNEMNDES